MLLLSSTFDQQSWRFSTAITNFAPCAHIRLQKSSEVEEEHTRTFASIRKVHFKIDPNREVEEDDLAWGVANQVSDPVQLRKMSMLDKMYAHMDPPKSIVFCNTPKNVDDVVAYLRHKAHACAAFDPYLFRFISNTLEEFRVGKSKILVTTDIGYYSGRLIPHGVDIEHILPDVNLVAIFDIPKDHNQIDHIYGAFRHCIGHTAHFGSKVGASMCSLCQSTCLRLDVISSSQGCAVIMTTGRESEDHFAKIENHFTWYGTLFFFLCLILIRHGFDDLFWMFTYCVFTPS